LHTDFHDGFQKILFDKKLNDALVDPFLGLGFFGLRFLRGAKKDLGPERIA